MSLCSRRRESSASCIDPIGPGTRALASLSRGEKIDVYGPLGNGYRLDVPRPLLVGGGIGVAPFPYLSEPLGSPPALLGFRSAWHAEAAALVPNAEVVLEPTYVTERIPVGGYDVLACGPEPMLEAVRVLEPDAQLAWEAPMACGYGACYGCAVEIDGELKRLCVEGPVLGRAHRPAAVGTILNASGCLDALTAPDVARSLDAFVTKTVTPLPREGNAPVRIAETEAGMLNSIGLANPGRDRFLADYLPRLRELGVPLWVSVGGFGASEYARDLRAPSRTSTIELNLSCPNVDEAADTAAEIVAACRAATTVAALREALAGDLGHRARSPARSRRRAPTGSRSSTRSAASRSTSGRCAGARHRARRPIRAGAEADRARRRARLPARATSDRRDGRRPRRTRRARAGRRGRERRRARHGALRRPGRARADSSASSRPRSPLWGTPRVDDVAGDRSRGADRQPGVESSAP